MSKWCDSCYRNELTGKWKSCGADCPVFGKNFEDLAKIVVASGLYDGELCVQQTRSREDFEREVLELSNELENLISYDEWAAREYGSTSVDNYDTAFNLIKAGYRKTKRKFFDTETREIITEDVLEATLEELKECDPDTYGNITLAQYINNCLTIHNGTLEEI